MSTPTLFMKIVRREIPATIVYESDAVLAFRDTNAQAPTHILVIPKEPIPDVLRASQETIGELVAAANEIVLQEGLEKEGFRYVINTGENGGQSVFHLHLHILGGRAMGWPPG